MPHVTTILGNEVGVQYQGTRDASSLTGAAQVSGLIVGQFKRGRLDQPMTITLENVKGTLGEDLDNPDYLAVLDALAGGVPSVQVMRLKGGDIDPENPENPEPFGVTDFKFYSSGNNYLGRFKSLAFILSGFPVNDVTPWHILVSFNFYSLNLTGNVSDFITSYNNGMGEFTLSEDTFGIPLDELTESNIRKIFKLSIQDGEHYFNYRGHRAGVFSASGQGMQGTFTITPHTPLKAWTP